MGIEVRAAGSRATATGFLLLGAVIAALWGVSDSPLIALFLLPVIPASVRVAMERVRTTDDRLLVRNFFRSYEMDRSEITGFTTEDLRHGRASRERIVYVHRREGKPGRLVATGFWYWTYPNVRRRAVRNQADEICEQLNDWLRQGA